MAADEKTPIPALIDAARRAASETHEETVAKAKALLATLPEDHPRRALAEKAVKQIEESDGSSPWVLAG